MGSSSLAWIRGGEPGGQMVRRRDVSCAGPEMPASSERAAAAWGRLNDAVIELKRLTQRELFQALEQVAGTDHIGGASRVNVESVRNLQLWSAEHLRLAVHLEAAARCCRIIERELNSQIDTLLTDG